MVKRSGETARTVYVPKEYEAEWQEVRAAMDNGEKMSTVVGEALRAYFRKKKRSK